MKKPETHQEKMARKKADRAQRVGFAERSTSVKDQVEKFCAFWRAVRRKNGLGSKQARAKALASIALAAE